MWFSRCSRAIALVERSPVPSLPYQACPDAFATAAVGTAAVFTATGIVAKLVDALARVVWLCTTGTQRAARRLGTRVVEIMEITEGCAKLPRHDENNKRRQVLVNTRSPAV